VRLLRSLAVFELSRGNVDYALGYIQEAIQQARQLGNHALVALAIRTQVGILREDGTEPAILLAMSVEAVREGQLGTDGIELAMALYSLGTLRVEIGDVAEGRADLESALPLLEAALRLGETRKTLGFRGGVLLSLARAVYLQGDRERARELWCESLAIEHSVGERFWAARSIEGLAHLMADSEPVSALVLGAGVIKLWQDRGLPLPKSVQDGVGWVEQTRASLPPQVAAKALSDGRAMRFDALVAAALSSCKGESV
jgi:tetratricopeptide (TPR) repeat protein